MVFPNADIAGLDLPNSSVSTLGDWECFSLCLQTPACQFVVHIQNNELPSVRLPACRPPSANTACMLNHNHRML